MSIAAAIAAAAADAPSIVLKGIEKVPGRYVLVDGDYLVYYTSGNNETPIGDARLRLMQKLDDLKTMSGAEHVVVHLTATGSHKGHRYAAATTKPYQENRSGGSRPKNWDQLRDFVESYKGNAFRQKIWGTREADDGICYHAKVLPYGKAVIAMKDKDSQMFTGCIHMDWDTFELTEVPTDTYEMENSAGRMFGHKWFWLQLLMGDSADNIPGLPLIRSHTGKMILCGAARAKDALCMTSSNEEAFDIVSRHYANHYKDGWADALAEQMVLLWMRQDKDALLSDCLYVVPDNGRGSDIEAAVERLSARIQEAINATPDY